MRWQSPDGLLMNTQQQVFSLQGRRGRRSRHCVDRNWFTRSPGKCGIGQIPSTPAENFEEINKLQITEAAPPVRLALKFAGSALMGFPILACQHGLVPSGHELVLGSREWNEPAGNSGRPNWLRHRNLLEEIGRRPRPFALTSPFSDAPLMHWLRCCARMARAKQA